jgi:hypothetical protein
MTILHKEQDMTDMTASSSEMTCELNLKFERGQPISQFLEGGG